MNKSCYNETNNLQKIQYEINNIRKSIGRYSHVYYVSMNQNIFNEYCKHIHICPQKLYTYEQICSYIEFGNIIFPFINTLGHK